MDKENKKVESWDPPTEEEIGEWNVRMQVMEMFARIGGRTLGIKLEGDQDEQ